MIKKQDDEDAEVIGQMKKMKMSPMMSWMTTIVDTCNRRNKSIDEALTTQQIMHMYSSQCLDQHS